ncbi:MAG: CsgG/HfaB family protein [Sedimentisphaerales bacterium]|jgi:hypothetical protein|nr:CsgG/HfaB family protein [Sedimentisphaerales bacterium]
MRYITILTLTAALMAAGCSSERAESVAGVDADLSKYDSVAIVDISGAVYGDAVKNQISDFFAMELMRKGYRVVERARVQKLLEEQKFQASDLTSNEGAARAGRILNVPAVLMVSIPKYENERLSMTAKLIDVEQGNIIWIGEGSGTTGKTMSTIVGAAAGAILGGAVAGNDSSDRTIGAIAGGVLGGVAGNALSPEMEEQVKKVVQKVCKDLPSRIGKRV